MLMTIRSTLSITLVASLSPVCAPAGAQSPSSAGAQPEAGPAVAYVVRPSDPSRYNPVERLALDKSLRPVSRTPVNLGCSRVHVAYGGELVCLTQSKPGKPGKFTPNTTYLYSPAMAQLASFERPVSNMPSRARISADGQYLATTTFTSGHSYLGVGGTQFSTETIISKRADGATAQDIQKWAISWKGQPVTALDLNLWGVTFDPRQSDRFFVTVYFKGTPYLGEGSVAKRAINVLRPNVECPSLSPDGQRIAFKRRVSATAWAPAILELATQKERVIQVPNSVDDQIEWLDDHTIVYEVSNTPLFDTPKFDLYMVDLSAAQPKQVLWLDDARSPTFVRASL
jgi:hypothetical protein